MHILFQPFFGGGGNRGWGIFRRSDSLILARRLAVCQGCACTMIPSPTGSQSGGSFGISALKANHVCKRWTIRDAPTPHLSTQGPPPPSPPPPPPPASHFYKRKLFSGEPQSVPALCRILFPTLGLSFDAMGKRKSKSKRNGRRDGGGRCLPFPLPPLLILFPSLCRHFCFLLPVCAPLWA